MTVDEQNKFIKPDPDEISEAERREAIASTQMVGEILVLTIVGVVATVVIYAAWCWKHHGN